MNYTISISAETEDVKKMFIQFLSNYKVQIAQYINQVLGNNGTPVDAGVDVDTVNETVKVYQVSPDKGFVIGNAGESSTPSLQQYQSLPVGSRYLIYEDNRVLLYLKEETGKPDTKIGAFRTLSDAVTEFNSEEVGKALKQIAEYKAAKAKEQKRTENRIARLKKQGVELPQADTVDYEQLMEEEAAVASAMQGEIEAQAQAEHLAMINQNANGLGF